MNATNQEIVMMAGAILGQPEGTADNRHPFWQDAVAQATRANAALEALRSMPAEPYAYAVYFPDQPTEELVHVLDELLDDMTNREHTITPLFATPHTAPVPLSDAEIDELWKAPMSADWEHREFARAIERAVRGEKL